MMGFLKSLLITIELWGVGRVLPAFLQAALGTTSDAASNLYIRMFFFAVMLPISWIIAKKISKGEHRTCIKVNLIIFFLVEGSSVFPLFSYMINSSYYSYRMGLYSGKFYNIIIVSFLFTLGYCGSIIGMIKATPSTLQEGGEYCISKEVSVRVRELADIDLYTAACELVVLSGCANEAAMHDVLEINREECKLLLESMDRDGITELDDSGASRRVRITEAEWEEQKQEKLQVKQQNNSTFVSVMPEEVKDTQTDIDSEQFEKIIEPAAPNIVIESDRVCFCRYCGFKLLDDSLFCSKCGKPIDGIKNLCKMCGKELAPGVSFCHYCGTKV